MIRRTSSLFARDRVLGARLALVATAVTGVAGTVLAAVRASSTAVLTTALLGVGLVAAAGLVLGRARSRRSVLRLRDSLRQDAP